LARVKKAGTEEKRLERDSLENSWKGIWDGVRSENKKNEDSRIDQ